ncbi:efflux RND transporter periplasmic adaptor subunit [Desulfoluna spongiiphila]|uniref:efflux RND transporter periplasmic adaptor subunit n=1 Tax=Desulfoluna spongiiphila TaxID=419481 RepID=UPI000B83A32F|nr:efflux RND transporter periplasmic adaptor subunit [Desulfoluna spongiiphila]
MDSKKRDRGPALARRLPLGTGLMILVAVLLLSCGRRGEKEPEPEVVRPAKLFRVTSAVEENLRELPGRVRASRRADLAFQVSGPLTTFPVEEGDPVKRGEVVARILPRDFKTALATAKANELEAMHQYNRYKDLYIKKQVSKADFDRAKREYDVAKSDVTNAENALKDTYLRAPFAGVIARRYVENFQEVRAKDPIVSLQDVSELEIVVDVPETLMARVRNKSKGAVVAEVEFSAMAGVKHDLTLKEFSTEADDQTQTYRVVLALPAPKGANILPGMTAKVTGKSQAEAEAAAETEDKASEDTVEGLKGIKVKKGFLVPVNSVFADETGREFVWVVDSGNMTVEMREVKVGSVSGSSIIVLEGLEAGEAIVSAGVSYLQSGMKIRELRSN